MIRLEQLRFKLDLIIINILLFPKAATLCLDPRTTKVLCGPSLQQLRYHSVDDCCWCKGHKSACHQWHCTDQPPKDTSREGSSVAGRGVNQAVFGLDLGRCGDHYIHPLSHPRHVPRKRAGVLLRTLIGEYGAVKDVTKIPQLAHQMQQRWHQQLYSFQACQGQN